MRQPITYRGFLQGILGIILLGLCYTTTVPYAQWMLTADIEMHERCCLPDGSAEEEERQGGKDKKDIKYRPERPTWPVAVFSSPATQVFEISAYCWNYPERITPPPESFPCDC